MVFRSCLWKTNNQQLTTDKELTSQQKKEIAKEILPVIAKIPDTIEQADYIGKLARKLNLSDQIIFDALEKFRNPQTKNAQSYEKTKSQLTTEEIFICLIIKNPEYIKTVLEKVKPTDLDGFAGRVYTIIENWYNKKEETELTKIFGKELTSKEFKQLELLLLEVEISYKENVSEVLTDLTTKIRSDKKELIKAKFAEAISEAESQNDREKLKKLIKEFQEAIK